MYDDVQLTKEDLGTGWCPSTFYRDCPVSESADGGAPDVTRGAEEHVGVVLGLHPVQGRHWRSYFYNWVVSTVNERKGKILRWILPQIMSSCKSVVTCGWCGSARAPQRPGHEGEPVEAVGPPVAGVVPLVRAVPRALAPAAARHRARVRPGARHGVASSVLEIWTNIRTTEFTNMFMF